MSKIIKYSEDRNVFIVTEERELQAITPEELLSSIGEQLSVPIPFLDFFTYGGHEWRVAALFGSSSQEVAIFPSTLMSGGPDIEHAFKFNVPYDIIWGRHRFPAIDLGDYLNRLYLGCGENRIFHDVIKEKLLSGYDFVKPMGVNKYMTYGQAEGNQVLTTQQLNDEVFCQAVHPITQLKEHTMFTVPWMNPIILINIRTGIIRIASLDKNKKEAYVPRFWNVYDNGDLCAGDRIKREILSDIRLGTESIATGTRMIMEALHEDPFNSDLMPTEPWLFGRYVKADGQGGYSAESLVTMDLIKGNCLLDAKTTSFIRRVWP